MTCVTIKGISFKNVFDVRWLSRLERGFNFDTNQIFIKMLQKGQMYLQWGNEFHKVGDALIYEYWRINLVSYNHFFWDF